MWWAHTLDWLYDSLSSSPVAGVWWAHTLDCLYDSLSSPPVAGVWWAHTLDCLYDSLSSPPVAGVWWAHTLDWLYDSLSCSWCVVSAYTRLSLWLSLLSTCKLVCGERIHLIVSMSLSSSPPVAVCGERIHLIALWLSLLSTCKLVCGERIHLNWLYDSLSCSWCVVSAYTPLSSMSLSSLSLPCSCVWWAHTLDWL